MFRRNLKKSFYLLIGLFGVGLVGIFLALVEFNTSYREKHLKISSLSAELEQLESQMNLARTQLGNYDFLAFKANVFEKRDPHLSRITKSVYKKSTHYGFQPELVLSMMKVESGYNPRAVSRRGAYGLMQVNFSVWKDELGIDKKRIFDIDYNIDLGLQILKRYYLESKGNLKRALHLYNNGYKYKNYSYVNKVEAQFRHFSLSKSPESQRSAGMIENGSDLDIMERKEK
jgi:soluble lytic murein transglycosylase-like protein